jgi:HD-GYP domain-containing protein (c-di-GMP phosphodiesterase class II)
VRDSILLKPRSLSLAELEVIRKHPTYGNAILGPLKFLGDVGELVKCHHECWDGSGYPEGLKGEQIPLASRIISVADSFDAMTSNRPYREARNQQEAIEEIKREAGRQLDPKVVETFLSVIEKKQLQDPPAEAPGDEPQPGT